MDSDLIWSFVAHIGLIAIGIVMRGAKNGSWAVNPYKKYWLYFIIVGALLLLYDIYKFI